jgi:hypothetical protein
MTEPRAGLKRGYYLLNTDGGNSGDPLGRAAIGALLRTRRLVTVAQRLVHQDLKPIPSRAVAV